jgi:hypothetical protein
VQQAIGGNLQHDLPKAATCAPLAIQALNIEPKEDLAIEQLIPLSRNKPN